MVEIMNKTTSVQAEGVYGVIKVVGNTEFSEAGTFNNVAGSLYKKDAGGEVYLGSFNSNVSLSVNIDNKDNAGLLGDVAVAVNAFIGDLTDEIQKGGAE